MSDGSLFNEIMLEEKLVELWPDYSCLLPREIAGFQEQDFKNLEETFTHVCFLFCNQEGNHRKNRFEELLIQSIKLSESFRVFRI